MSELHKRSLSQSHLSAHVIKIQDKHDSTEKLEPQSSDNCVYSLVKKSSEYSMIKHLKSYSSNGFRANIALSCDFEELEDENDTKLLNMSSEDIVLSNSLMYTPSTTPLSKHSKSIFNYSPENTSSSTEQTPKLIRAKAKEYRKMRGKNLFSKIDETPSNEITTSNSNIDICLPPTPLSETENNNLNIQKIIKIQAVIRRHLTMKKIRENEEYRVKYRTALENNFEYEYRQEIKRIEKLLKNGLKCKEYDEAVEQVKEYVNDVLKDPMDVNDYKTKVQYLFSLCDENQQGCLEEEQFLVLTEEIMKLSVPKLSYEHLFNKDNHIYCDFERFYRWFNHRKEKGVRSNGLFRQISNLFSGTKLYPYMCHIKCVLHEELVTSKLKEYDANNPPLFQCPICCKVYVNPLLLSKHIVQCNYDNFIVSNTNQ